MEGTDIKIYDGSTNLDKNLNVYKTHTNLYTTNKAVWCRVFPNSLQEGALSWFTQLPPNSVDSFKTLLAKFNT